MIHNFTNTKTDFAGQKTVSGLVVSITAIAVLGLSACSSKAQTTEPVTPTIEMSTIDKVLAGGWRTEQSARDQFRHPKETLAFFGLKPGQKIVEIYPGGGWYTNILAPYAKATGGTFIAVGAYPKYLEKFGDSELYGTIHSEELNEKSGPMSVTDADIVLTFRSIHSVNRNGIAQKAFHDFYAALKPGGVLGVVAHRLPESREQDLKTSTGYAQVSFTKALAAKAGFEFVASSEINANPKDTADHPFGVWTLPPSSQKARRGEEMAEGFDAAKYLAIGESDRFTLKFRKPK